MGDLDGRLLVLGRDVRQLRRRPGRRQVHAGRHPRPRVPAAPGGAHLRLQQAPADDPGQPRPRAGASATTPRAPRSGRATRPRRAEPRGPRGLRGRAKDRSADARRSRPRADRPGARFGPGGRGPIHLPRARPGLPRRRSRGGTATSCAGSATRRGRSTASSPASTASTTCRRSRGSASTTSS